MLFKFAICDYLRVGLALDETLTDEEQDQASDSHSDEDQSGESCGFVE